MRQAAAVLGLREGGMVYILGLRLLGLRLLGLGLRLLG